MSKSTWAGSVVAPGWPTSAATVSVTSRSRSVALRTSERESARSSTFERIAIVLRRSTTRCTWPSDFRSAVLSSVTFIEEPIDQTAARLPTGGEILTRRAQAAQATAGGVANFVPHVPRIPAPRTDRQRSPERAATPPATLTGP